jgi:hypothetical protein
MVAKLTGLGFALDADPPALALGDLILLHGAPDRLLDVPSSDLQET